MREAPSHQPPQTNSASLENEDLQTRDSHSREFP